MGFGLVVRGGVSDGGVVLLELDGMNTWRGEPEAERWNEAEAIRLLQEVGAVVAWYGAEGVGVPNRETYHARIVEAHSARDMVAYRASLNGYKEAAREAHRRRARGGG